MKPMKKILYILLFYSKISLGQAPTKIWDKTIGGNAEDIIYAMVATNDGGFVAVGHSYSGISGDKSENVRGSGTSDYWVVRFNNLGQKVWDKTLGGIYYDGVPTFSTGSMSVVATADGGFVVAGSSGTVLISGDKTETGRGGNDYWVVKLSSNGQKVWDKTLGGVDDDFATSLTIANDGNIIVAGTSFSPISGDKTENEKTQGWGDYWVVKINESTGQKIWDKDIGGTFQDYAYSIVATNDGGVVVAGVSYSGVSSGTDKSEPRQGPNDFWVVKLNSLGQKVWDKTLGGSGEDYASSIIATNDGGFVILGYSSSPISGQKSEANRDNSNATFDYWLLKINSLGQKVWDKTLGGNSTDLGNSIINTIDGGFMVSGLSMSAISADKTETNRDNTNSTSDYWIVKLNGLGQKVWDKTLGSSINEFSPTLIENLDESIIIAGSSSSNISGDKTENSKGSSDYWIVKCGEIIFETITTGNWNANTTWNTNTPPTATNTAKINATHSVNIPNAGNNVKTIQMNGGNINLTGGTLEIKNQ
jgi:hypothetical protein